MSYDPFATVDQMPGQESLPEMPAPTQPEGSDLSGAPEIGVSGPAAAQTEPGTKQRKTEADKAQAVLDRAIARRDALQAKVNRMRATLATVEAQLASQTALCDHQAQHPALQND